MSQTSAPKTSILAMPVAWDLVSEGYAKVTQPMLAQFSQLAIERAQAKSSDQVLDVACGPGTTSLLISPSVDSIQALDFSPEMLKQFEQNLQGHEPQNIEYQEGNGQDLPYDNDEFDLAFSMFGWMFFPDRTLGLQELQRCLRSGGQVYLSSWFPRHENPLFKILMSTMLHINPQMEEPPKITNPLELPENFKQELEDAGFLDVKVEALKIQIAIEDVDVFWDQMVQGNAPVALMKRSLPAREWKKRSKKAVAFLKKNLELKEYEMCAWLASGRAP